MSEQTANAAETAAEPENLESLFSDKTQDTDYCKKLNCQPDRGKDAGIFLVLSKYNASSTLDDYYVSPDESDLSANPYKDITYKGIQTNDAPIQHLIDEVYRTGYNLKKVVCITTQDAYQSNYDRFKNLVEGYINSVWDKQILIEHVDYDSVKGDADPYYDFYKDLNEKASDLDAFFVDYTGGLRDTSFLMVVAIRFLEFKKIKCEKVIYSDFHAKPKTIKSLNSVYNLFQMINGMNEFISSGTTRQLDDVVFNQSNSLIRAIRNFSHATNVGDVEHLDHYVNELAAALDEEQKTSQNGTGKKALNEIMVSSMNEIIRSKIFGVNDNRTLTQGSTIDYYRLIDWCIENKMYQQAATLYIEKIPVIYWQNHIIDNLVGLSEEASIAGSKEVATFYTALPKWLFSDPAAEGLLDCLKKFSIEKDKDRWRYSDFIYQLRMALGNYPKPFERLRDIIRPRYQNFHLTTPDPGPVRIQDVEIPIKQKTIITFMNDLKSKSTSELFYFLVHGSLEGYVRQTGDEKSRLLNNLKASFESADETRRTNDDRSLYKLLAFYLAIKVLRNKMSHAAEGNSNHDQALVTGLEGFLNEILGPTEAGIKISLEEQDIHKLLTTAITYSKHAQVFRKA